jgi:hypothetical protein
MVHDDWRGTLFIRPPDQRLNEVDGSCTYTSWVIDGTYTGDDGIGRTMRGRFGGRDLNKRTNEQCKQSDHKVRFTIAFPNNEPPQPFEGYLYTRRGKTLAGYTWWQGIPFGWSAQKRP